MAFLMRQKEASMLADLILGGEGIEKTALEESDLDALKEALTQVAGSGAPTLSVTLGREVGFDPPRVEGVPQGGLDRAVPWKQAFLGVGTIRVEGVLEAPLRILLPIPVAQEMAGLVAQTAEEEPLPSPRATQAPPPFESFRPGPAPAAEIRNIDLILDIEVEVMVRLGGAVMPLREVQRLRPGSIIDLDKDTEAPMELVVNDKVIAKGELVVVGSDHFALRITEIESPLERIRRLGA
jgi:flagellar motor switch protein FliN/FliY